MRRLLLGMVLTLTGCSSASVPMASEQQPVPATYHIVAGTTLSPASREPEHFRMWRFSGPVVPVQVHDQILVPPADPQVLGWWGKPAGSRHGTTLLTGHSVHTGGGELDTLASTPVGVRANVSGIPYRVDRVFVVSKTRLAKISARLFSQTGRARLVVISCARYDWTRHLWPANAVVIAHQVDLSN